MTKKQIISEIKKHLGFKNDVDFAKHLGIKQNTLSSWKSRNTMDYELVISKCEEIDANWLITGKGNMLKPEKTTATEVETQNKTLESILKNIINNTLKESISEINSRIDVLRDDVNRLNQNEMLDLKQEIINRDQKKKNSG